MDAAVAATELTPVAANERIQALDVIRGFALLGIFLMNIEWFNRPLADLGAGMATGLAGVDYAAAWFIDVFVRGKFWTMFSMLFGMGFAVMLARAAAARRSFIAPYLRRTAALAAFGLLHGVLIWGGDILLSYATAAFVLLLTLFSRFWQGLLIAAAVALAGFAFQAGQAVGGFIVVLAVACFVALYLRNERSVRIAGKAWPLLSAILAASGALAAIAGGIGIIIKGQGHPAAIGGIVLIALAWLSARYRNPPELRKARAGAALYLVPALAMLIGAAIALVVPESSVPKPTAEQTQQIEKRRAEHRKEVAAEAKTMSSGTYAEAVAFRSRAYLGDYVQQAGFAMIVLGLFLLGAWFVQSGVILHPERHAALFRKMVWIGLPLGLAMAVIGHYIAPSHVPGQNDKLWQLAIGMQMVGNLPLTLAYVSAIVLLLQNRGVPARMLSWLAPAGRMALTNYLSQSVIASLFFYGYGLGHWGASRAWQVLFVLFVFGLQLLVSRWWLSNFRYGPMEWLWRWATYARRPAMRAT